MLSYREFPESQQIPSAHQLNSPSSFASSALFSEPRSTVQDPPELKDRMESRHRIWNPAVEESYRKTIENEQPIFQVFLYIYIPGIL